MLQLLHHISRQFRGSNDFKRLHRYTSRKSSPPQQIHTTPQGLAAIRRDVNAHHCGLVLRVEVEGMEIHGPNLGGNLKRNPQVTSKQA